MKYRISSSRHPPLGAAADSLGIALVMLDVTDFSDPERVERPKAHQESFGFTA